MIQVLKNVPFWSVALIRGSQLYTGDAYFNQIE